MARIVGTSLSISTKQAIEICSLLRRKNLSFAKRLLNEVIKGKQAIPFTRFNSDMGHKPGIGPGRYPKKASQEILNLLEGVEANAQFRGINTADLIIEHICAHKAGKVMRYGRKRGRKAKRTHVEVMVKETAKKKEAEKKHAKREEKKEAPKAKEVKEEVKKEEGGAKPKAEEKKVETKTSQKEQVVDTKKVEEKKPAENIEVKQ